MAAAEHDDAGPTSSWRQGELHGAIRRQRWRVAARLAGAASSEEDCHRWASGDSAKNLPLHLACVYGAPPAVVGALLAQHRGAAAEPNQLGHLPLHLAVRNCGKKLRADDQAAVVRAVLDACPAAATATDGDGNFPLHLAAAGGACIAAVQVLLAADSHAILALGTMVVGPGTIREPPLLLAVAGGADEAVLEQLLASHLEACRKQGRGGAGGGGGGGSGSNKAAGPAAARLQLSSLLALRDRVPQQVVTSLVAALYAEGDASAPALGLALNLMALQTARQVELLRTQVLGLQRAVVLLVGCLTSAAAVVGAAAYSYCYGGQVALWMAAAAAAPLPSFADDAATDAAAGVRGADL
eukprot:SAG22_NODE_154_length_17189_cov_38.210064_4_plen_355_part_00